MTLASIDIKNGRTVIETGLKYGYSSPTAFNRAFKSVHGKSPVNAKNEKCILSMYPKMHLAVSVSGDKNIKCRMEKFPEMSFVGYRKEITENTENNFSIVPDFWKILIENNLIIKLIEQSDELPKKIYGITSYKNGFNYYAAVKSNENNFSNTVEITVAETLRVIFECDENSPQRIQEIYKYFLTEWLPFSDYQFTEIPDIEIYTMNKNNTFKTEICIAVKRSE